jgi:putative FmdB family regulatory protein
MPMYDYKCPVCSRGREVMLKIADLGSPVYCTRCGSAMNRKISAPFVVGDYAAYDCPITGKRIEGRRAHEENLKQHGCRVLEPGESAQHMKQIERDEADLDRRVEETTDRFIAELPTEKRDRLAAELEGGLTTQFERSTPKF